MKILHIINSLDIGGAQRLLSDLLPLIAKTNDVSVLVYHRTDNHFTRKIEESGVRIISLEINNFYNPLTVLKIRKAIRGYDIIHSHLFPSLWWVALASVGINVKTVYTEHNTHNKRREKRCFRPLERLIFSKYDRIVSISNQTQDSLVRWLRIQNDKFVIINNGIDKMFFSEVKRPVIPKSLIMVSRFSSAKDQETVIRAMKLLDSGVTLRFVGGGPGIQQCKELANELGLSDRVLFLGERSDVKELVSESYIGIQSSKWEGFGLTAVEIMSCGKPIVGTRVDGMKQIIEGAGLLFEVGDSTELANCINALLNDEKLYTSCAEACRKRAAQYDIQQMAGKYLEIYKELLQD